jgi:branched-chain amino acid transport system permease protein
MVARCRLCCEARFDLHFSPLSYMQFVFNILFSASAMLLLALGFALIYRVSKFFHFAHGIVFTCGAYAALMMARAGLGLAIAVPIAIVLAAALGCALELCLYRPLRRQQATPLILLLASLGSYILIQNVISLIFGDAALLLPATLSPCRIMGARLSGAQGWTIVAGVLAVLATAGFLASKPGRAMRAVAANPSLANSIGLDPAKVVLYSMALGSALAGLGGVMLALDVGMRPTMGMTPLMLAVVAVIVGGETRLSGVVLGCLLVAACQHGATWHFGSQWQDVAAFAVLFVVVLARQAAGALRSATRAA